MKLLVATLLLLQFGPRPPLAPAETLLEPAILKAIDQQAATADSPAEIRGTDSDHDILLSCREGECGIAARAIGKLNALIASKTISQPVRTIRLVSVINPQTASRATAVIHVALAAARPLQVIRSPWSHPGIADEVVEQFARFNGTIVEARGYENVGQPAFESFGVPTTTVVTSPTASSDHVAFVAAAAAYFLATLPNAGSEALLSHLTVGAHERLAEDGRKAVAQMGSQQRASGDVLTMFANAIDREQRRMRSFEQFMPAPVDPMLHSRIVDMEKGITGVWASIGITPSPFVPPAERIRGRGGEDRRVVSRVAPGPLPRPELPTAFLKFENVDAVVYELGNFIDGQRSISDIRDAVSSEFAPIALPVVVEYFERLAKTGAIALR